MKHTQHKLCELKTDHQYAKMCLRYDVIKRIYNTPALILDKIETHSLNGFAGNKKHTMLQSFDFSCMVEIEVDNVYN